MAIKVQSLYKSYNNANVLTDINLNIQKGEIFGIVGQSGAGKSTLLRCMNGLELYQKGKMIVNDVDIAQLSKKELRVFRRKIGMIFQNFALLNRKTVLENVMFPMKCWNYGKMEMQKKAEEFLAMVGLADKMKAMPNEISGGQKQRVAIARALTLEPDILLCDEATSALDPAITKSILELLADINRQMNITIVMVTHDMSVVKSICDRMAIISNGKIDTKGSVKNVFLEESKELIELIGNKKIIASPGYSIIKLSISDKNQSFLFHLASELLIPYTLLSADIEQFNNEGIGHIYISVDSNRLPEVKDYCQTKEISFSVIENNLAKGGN